jgi:hypothetical protein
MGGRMLTQPLSLDEGLGRSIREIDWEDIEAVRRLSYPILKSIGDDPIQLGRLLDAAIADPALRPMFEHYDILDKIVLYDDAETGARLRLHIFLPGYFDRPHDHRWAYTTYILSGHYEHYSYLPKDFTDRNQIDAMVPSMVSTERRGSSYTYDSTLFHSIVAEPFTVSIILRGPAAKSQFLIVDRIEKTSWWQFGARDEGAASQLEKRMDDARLDECLNVLQSLSIVTLPHTKNGRAARG